MCLQGTIHTSTITQENAIVAWKEMLKTEDSSTSEVKYVPAYQSNDAVFKRGLNTSKRPGFHVYLKKEEALKSTRCYRGGHDDRTEYKLVRVKIWGRVRFGDQWNCECASATNMEIVNFTNILRWR